MAWIGDTSKAPKDQTLINLEQVRFITCAELSPDRLKVTLTMGPGQAVELSMSRAEHARPLELLGVRDIG